MRPAQNTREVIQFGVGSKLCGHLHSARCGAKHREGGCVALLTGHRNCCGSGEQGRRLEESYRPGIGT